MFKNKLGLFNPIGKFNINKKFSISFSWLIVLVLTTGILSFYSVFEANNLAINNQTYTAENIEQLNNINNNIVTTGSIDNPNLLADIGNSITDFFKSPIVTNTFATLSNIGNNSLALLTGSIEAQAAGTEYIFGVNTTSDTVDANPGDEVCADSNGQCSLRAATMEGNSIYEDGVNKYIADGAIRYSQVNINVPSGEYTLTIAPQYQWDSASGDLNITGNFKITGAGRGQTFIQAAPNASATPIDRVITIAQPANADIQDLTVRYGRATTYTNTVDPSDSTLNGTGIGGGIHSEVLFESRIGGSTPSQDTFVNCNNKGSEGARTILLSNCVDSGYGSGGFSSPRVNTLFRNAVNGIELSINIENVNINNNSAEIGGGGLYFGRNTLNINLESVNINNNQSTDGFGGGILISENLKSLITYKNNYSNTNPSQLSSGLISQTNISISNSSINSNSAKYGGGITNISQISGNNKIGIGIIDSQLSSNSAIEDGGAIHNNTNQFSYPTFIPNPDNVTFGLQNVTIKSNTAKNGAGIFNSQGRISLNLSEIQSNISVDKGSAYYGGKYGESGSGGNISFNFIDIIQSRISDNFNTSLDVTKSVIEANVGSVNILQSTFNNNTGKVVTIKNSLIISNQPSVIQKSTFNNNNGDAITFNQLQPTSNSLVINLTIQNNTISSNNGAGITLNSEPLTIPQFYNKIASNTIADNQAGIVINGGNNYQISSNLLSNNINNCAGSSINYIPSIGGSTSNLASDNSCSTLPGILTPQLDLGNFLAPLFNNGGPTQTRALLTGSQALDRIVTSGPGAITIVPSTDQRDAARVGGVPVLFDIGSFEFNGISNLPRTINFDVSTTDDTVDANPGNGICADVNGDCSLRAATMESNVLWQNRVIRPNEDDIVNINVPAGIYVLTIAPQYEWDSASGDLNLIGNFRLNGAGKDQTFIQAAPDSLTTPIDRVISANSTNSLIQPAIAGNTNNSSVEASIKNLTIRYGLATPYINTIDPSDGTINGSGDGGGLNSAEPLKSVGGNSIPTDCQFNNGVARTIALPNCAFDRGNIKVSGVNINDSRAVNKGAGVFSNNNLIVENSSIFNNSSLGDGGGLNSGSGLIIEDSIVSNNTALNGGGVAAKNAFLGTGAGGWISNTTINNNVATSRGGGIDLASDGSSSNSRSLNFNNSQIINNSAGVGGGIRSSRGNFIYFYQSKLNNNMATISGSAYSGESSSANIFYSDILGNRSSDSDPNKTVFEQTSIVDNGDESIRIVKIAKSNFENNIGKVIVLNNVVGYAQVTTFNTANPFINSPGPLIGVSSIQLQTSFGQNNNSYIERSSIINNNGDGITFNNSTNATITNNTISNNTGRGLVVDTVERAAQYTFGLGSNVNRLITIEQNTIANNDSGIRIVSGNRFNLINNISSGNNGSDCSGAELSNYRPTYANSSRFYLQAYFSSNNIASDNSCLIPSGFTIQLDHSNYLEPLADNGGYTKTLKLLPGSIAISRAFQGIANSNQTSYNVDQRNVVKSRFRDINVNQDNFQSDIGAYETGLAFTVLDKTFTVNTTDDTIDINPGDSYCADINGLCSLRAATIEHNRLADLALNSADIDSTIVVPSGIYQLTTAPRYEGDGGSGDLDLIGNFKLIGAGRDQTFIQAGDGTSEPIDRILSIGLASRAQIEGITFRYGKASKYIDTLRFPNCNSLISSLCNDRSTGLGGAISTRLVPKSNTNDINSNPGCKYTLTDPGLPTCSDETSRLGVNNNDGNSNNSAYFDLAGQPNLGNVTINDVDIRDNSAEIGGGGIFYGSPDNRSAIGKPNIAINNTNIFNNSTAGLGGGYLTGGNDVENYILNFYSGAAPSVNLVAYSGTAVINNSNINNNQARLGGGLGHRATDSVVTINSSRIENNTATEDGGGIHNYEGNNCYVGCEGVGTIYLNNSFVLANNAVNGGGIFNSEGRVVSTDTTIEDNESTNEGAAYYGSLAYLYANRTVIGRNTNVAQDINKSAVYSLNGLILVHDSEIAFNTGKAVVIVGRSTGIGVPAVTNLEIAESDKQWYIDITDTNSSREVETPGDNIISSSRIRNNSGRAVNLEDNPLIADSRPSLYVKGANIIDNGRRGFTVTNAKLRTRYTNIENNFGTGVLADGNSQIDVYGTSISNHNYGVVSRNESIGAITNSTISNNLYAGVVLDTTNAVELVHNTIANNGLFDNNPNVFGPETQSGGIIFRVGTNHRLYNNLLSGNQLSATGSDCSGIGLNDYISSLSSNSNFANANLASDSSCSTVPSFSVQNDLPSYLGQLQDNGGVKVGRLSDNDGNTLTHELLLGNQALSAANPNYLGDNDGVYNGGPVYFNVIFAYELDQRDRIRPVGNGPDIGSFESTNDGNPPNFAPLPENDNYSTDANTPIILDPNPIDNDIDPEGDEIFITNIDGYSLSRSPDSSEIFSLNGGTLNITYDSNGAPTFEFVPDFEGSFSYEYEVQDSFGNSAFAAIFIEVTPVFVLIAVDDFYTTPSNTPLIIRPLENDRSE